LAKIKNTFFTLTWLGGEDRGLTHLSPGCAVEYIEKAGDLQ